MAYDRVHENARLLGRQVEVTLNNDGPVVARGLFLGFGEDGEFEIQDAMGVVHYCWPMLNVREV